MDRDLKRICLNRSVLDFMERKLTRDSWVLELGGGYSSRWFADRCGKLTIVETVPKWRRTIERELQGADCFVTICPDFDHVQGCSGVDLVLVDCDERLREKAAKIGWQRLNSGGWLVFDDAQRPRHWRTARWLERLAASSVSLLWQEGDIDAARERVAIAFKKI